jgi:cyclomaltodextrinase
VASSVIVYGVIVPSFSADGLRGVEAKLPYLRHLGVTMVWLSPIFEHPPRGYGYAMTDYKRVDSEHGSHEDLQRLVQAAHHEGLRIMLDFAPNHTSDLHRYYQDLNAVGYNSRYADYYARDDAGRYTHYFNWTNLINLNYDNPDVPRMVLEAMEYWIVECDIDGYRMDAAWGIRQRTPHFWPHCLRRLRTIKPDLFILAEASTLDPYYSAAGFDSAYDWTNHLGTWAWGHAFGEGRSTANDLRYHLEKSTANGDVFRFLNNNDTGPRFITAHGDQLNRLATALLLTLPGTPCLYMGDEVGLEFAPYHQRECVTWLEDADLFEFHRRLITLRCDHVPGTGPLTIVDNDRGEECLSLSQPDTHGLPLVSVFNFGPPADVTLTLEHGLTCTALDLWSGRSTHVDGGVLSVALGRHEFAILELTG